MGRLGWRTMMRARTYFAAAGTALLIANAVPLTAQLPIPVQGQRGQTPSPQAPGQPGQPTQERGRGRGKEPAKPDQPPVESAIAPATPKITSPGKLYKTLMELTPSTHMA